MWHVPRDFPPGQAIWIDDHPPPFVVIPTATPRPADLPVVIDPEYGFTTADDGPDAW